jgi:DNA polymerase I-like protein with 3'-5' exonuclease and polymerase domains
VLEEWTQKLCSSPYLAVDIESVKKSTHILCVGFAPSQDVGVCIPLTTYTQSFIQRILVSQAEKIFHFGLFDTEMLWLNGFEVTNYNHDTLLMQHILEPELPKSLDFLCSIYTREPYYKSSGRAEIPKDQKAWGTKADKKKLWEYNAKDCCVTYECSQLMIPQLKSAKLYNYYLEEMDMIEPFQAMGREGLPIDEERLDLLKRSLLNRYGKLQQVLDSLAGKPCNVRSPKLKDILYDELKLPTRRNREGNITTDEDAIVYLIGFVKTHIAGLQTTRVLPEWNKKLAILTGILKIRGVRQLISNYLNAKRSSNGNFRSTYKPAGPETGRSAAERYVDGTGFNPQTLPRTDIEVLEEDMIKPPTIDASEFIPDDDEDDMEDEAA